MSSMTETQTPKRKLQDTKWSPNSEELDLDSKKNRLLSSEFIGEAMADPDMAEQLMADIDKQLEVRFNSMRKELVDDIRKGLVDRIDGLEKRVDDLEAENVDLRGQLIETSNARCEEELAVLRRQVQTSEGRIVEMEQYSRKGSVKVYGLKEEIGEDVMEKVVRLITDDVKVEITKQDLIAAHRIPSEKKPRPVIVKFTRREPKDMTLRHRRNLKGKGVFINEDLCRSMQQLFNRVHNDDRVQKAWTWNGKVFFLDHADEKHQIKYGQSLDSVLH